MTQADGEKELVLGNKQLISLFFVVVALCGVFFAMGYMIGRNSTKAVMAAAATDSPSAPPAPVQTQQAEPPRETASDQGAQTPVAADPAPIADTKPAQDTKPPEPTVEVKEEKPAPSETGGSYLQVTALPRPDAENVVRTLKEQNFPAIVSESSKDGLFRVLVGPYHQTSQLAESKARLKTLGFANAFVQKQ